jgi:hypothetical protein
VKLDFATVDVFTDRQFGGNPLAVVPDARALTSGQMQAIAAEFNLAETTFVLPPRFRLQATPISAPLSCWSGPARASDGPSRATTWCSKRRRGWCESKS